MKKLWKRLAPPLADSFGFMEVIRHTDGIGLLDDCGGYRLAEGRHDGPDARTGCSEADEADIVGGTREKVIRALKAYQSRKQSRFALLGFGPCVAMIGTDHEEIAAAMTDELGIPVGAVKVTGQKNYDTGISEVILGMIKLLYTSKGEVIPGSINLLGGTSYDLGEENARRVKAMVEAQGVTVIAQPGQGTCAEEIAKMSEASLNVMLTVSGLAAAKYLREVFGTPYLAISPFGETFISVVKQAIKAGDADSEMEHAGHSLVIENASRDKDDEHDGENDILIIAEQLTANALRCALLAAGTKPRIQAASLFQMEKSLMKKGDRRLRSEDDVAEILRSYRGKTVIADPAYRVYACAETKWIDLPHPTLHQYDDGGQMPELLGDKLQGWLFMQIQP